MISALDLAAFAGSVTALAALILGIVVARRSESEWAKVPALRLGFVTLSGLAFYKLAAAFAFVGLPAVTVAAGSYKLLEGTHETQACASCHVMQPMVTDLSDPTSTSLAARHARNGWISKQACYTCHSGYGFAGGLAAKAEGYRHLVRYTTGHYVEPIASRTVFDQASCLGCHADTTKFLAVNSHLIALPHFESNTLSCLNCHGLAHPTREDRTPGSRRYDALMGKGTK